MAEENTTSQPAKNQNPVIVFLIFIIVIGLLALAFFFGLKYRQVPSEVLPTPTPEVTNIPSPQPTPTPEGVSITPTVKSTPTVVPTSTPTPTVTPPPTSTPTPQADLYIDEYSFNHPPKKGEPFTVKISLYNKGNAASGPFWWEWWATWATKVCRERITDGIAAHGGRSVYCTFTYDSWANYQTKAVVDVDNEVIESDESNNTYTQIVMPIH